MSVNIDYMQVERVTKALFTMWDCCACVVEGLLQDLPRPTSLPSFTWCMCGAQGTEGTERNSVAFGAMWYISITEADNPAN